MTNNKSIKQIMLEKLSITKKQDALENLKNSLKNLKNSASSDDKSKIITANIQKNNFKISGTKKVLVMYIINFIFSPKNTFLHITDIKGNLKLYYSMVSIYMHYIRDEIPKVCQVLIFGGSSIPSFIGIRIGAFEVSLIIAENKEPYIIKPSTKIG